MPTAPSEQTIRLGLDFTASFSPFRSAVALEAVGNVLDRAPGLQVDVRVDPGGFHPSNNEDAAAIRVALDHLGSRPGVTLLEARPNLEDLERWLFGLDVLVLPAPGEANKSLCELSWVFGTRLVVPSMTPETESVIARFPFLIGDPNPVDVDELVSAISTAVLFAASQSHERELTAA